MDLLLDGGTGFAPAPATRVAAQGARFMRKPCFDVAVLSMLTSATVAAQCPTVISDDFTGADGSTPNLALWSLDHDCSQINVETTLVAGELSQQSCYADSCAAGCLGTDMYSKFTFGDFDMRIRFCGTVGGASASFGAFAVQSLPPSSSCAGPASPILTALRQVPGASPGVFTVQVMPQYPLVETPLDANLQPYQSVAGDWFRIRGVRGQFVRFYLNDKVIYEQSGWDLGVPSLSAFMSSQSDLTPGACHTTRWDNFSLTTYLPFSVSSITPNAGGSKGGQTVMLTGTGLDMVTSVTFGGLPAEIVASTPSMAQIVAPEGPKCRPSSAVADICLTSAGGTCCVAPAWTWLPHLSVATTWQPDSSVLLTMKGSHPGAEFILFAASAVLDCPGLPAPPSVDNFLLGGALSYVANLPAPTGTAFYGGLLPASWPPGLAVTLQAAEVPSQGTTFQLTNADS